MADSAKLEPTTLDKVLTAASIDKDFRKLFQDNPREVLDRLGIEFSPGYKLQVVEVPEGTIAISLWPLVSQS